MPYSVLPPPPADLVASGLATVLDHVSAGIIIQNRERRIVWANPAAAQILLMSRTQLLALERASVDWQAVGEDGTPLPATEHPVTQAFETGAPVRGVLMGIYSHQRTARWLSVDVLPLATPDGTPPRYVIVTFTERPTARAAAGGEWGQTLAPSEPLDIIPDAFFQLDRDWRFTYVNREAEELFDRPRAELMGQSLWEAMPELRDGPVDEQLHRVVETMQPLRFESPFPLPSRWVEIGAFPSQQGLSVYVADVTERYSAQREGRRLAYRNQLILNAIEAGIYGIDRDGRCTFINSAGAERLGYKVEEILGQEVHSLIHHTYIDGRPYPVDECPINHAMRGGEVVRSEEEVLWRADGTPLYVTYIASPVIEGEQITGAVVSFHDVTEARRRAAAQRFWGAASPILAPSVAPRDSLQQLAELIVPSIADWCVIELLERDGTVLPTFTVRTRDERQERAMQRLRQGVALPGIATIVQGPYEAGEPWFLPVVPDGLWESYAQSDEELELMSDLQLGSVILVPMRVRGVTIGTLSLARFEGRTPFEEQDLQLAVELTDRTGVAIENARLFGEAERFRETLDATHEAIYLLDPETLTLLYANQGLVRQVGYGRGELQGMTALALLPDFDEARLRALLEPLRAGDEERQVIETLHRTHEGEMVPVEMAVQYVQPEEGGGRFIVIAHDITQRREQEEALRERTAHLARLTRALARSNAELDQFAYIASHDLKAPLRGISNLSSWIEEDLGDSLSPETRHQISLLRNRVQRLEMLIDGLLQYSRLGRTHSRPVPIPLDALVAEVVDLLAPPPSFTIRGIEPLPTLWGERAPLEQLLMNLIGNAIKHHDRAEGLITIEARDLGDRVEITVRDDGPGIATQYHEKIFMIFQRLTTQDQVEGTGLGLSLAKKIVEQQGGVLRVESDGARGSSFIFTWPKRQEHSHEQQ